VSFLGDLQWHSRIFTGSWQQSAGGDAAVVEPATGNELGRVGLAGLEDLTVSAAQASVAQREWAATPFPERATVLRRAADLLQRHTDELRSWIVRETGGIPGKAYFELGHAVQNCYEAAALPSRS
jgi:benzaldehyde dehydrogenase (NAD)